MRVAELSGLICLNWYDWNEVQYVTDPEISDRRDWSAWIDTIETLTTQYPVQSSLWSRDWSALIDTIETSTNVWACFWFLNVGRDWSAWIDTIETLHNLHRLFYRWACRDWSAWIDTIETIQGFSKITNHLLSGLICLNWYDWNMVPVSFSWPWTSRRDWSAWIDTIETLLYNWLQGRDLLSGLICLNWYDWNLSQRCSRSTGSTHCRDWSAWIDTIETIS